MKSRSCTTPRKLNQPEWEVAGIYADDGISGVHTKKRDGFNQMIQDCKKHRIDLILTKSISRFARNTLDSIQYVRMLKQMGIAVVFEKGNINTATMNSEMILTVLSAFAQAESESISQNVARGKRMGYKHGKFAFPYGRIIGYRKGADGKPEIIPEQAEIIRLIFNSYLQGTACKVSRQSWKRRAHSQPAATPHGQHRASQRILQNEKYCGDVLLQKTFTEDVLTGYIRKTPGSSRNITLKITTRASLASRYSERCKPRLHAETASRQLTNASAAGVAITANMLDRTAGLR